MTNLSDEGIQEIFIAMPTAWKRILLFSWSGWYAALPLIITYISHLLVEVKEISWIEWVVLCAERSPVLSSFKLWQLSPWLFAKVFDMANHLLHMFLSDRNCADLPALLERTRELHRRWFDEVFGVIPTNGECCWSYIELRQRFIP